MSAGKGSTPRKVDCAKYAVNYEKIFGKTEVYICHKCYRIKEWHHIYGMTCEECDFDQLVTICNHLNPTTNGDEISNTKQYEL